MQHLQLNNVTIIWTFAIAMFFSLITGAEAFLVPSCCYCRCCFLPSTTTTTKRSTTTYVFMKRNKQMDLARKLEIAKEQARQRQQQQEEEVLVGNEKDGNPKVSTSTSTTTEKQQQRKGLTDAEIKRQNDRKRFEELLNSESATAANHAAAFNPRSSYLTQNQEEAEMTAGFRGVERIFEGDLAPSSPFDDLCSMKPSSNGIYNAIGDAGTQRLLPWLNNKKDPNNKQQKQYLVVLSEPRLKSLELRQTIKVMIRELSPEIRNNLIVINADSPSQNRKWCKKNSISDLDIFSDEKREWMREYTALGDNRWSMTLFILANGRVEKLIRELDGILACTAITNAVKSL